VLGAIVVLLTVIQLFKHNVKKLAPAAISIALSFLPWLLRLIHVEINALTGLLFQTVVFMAVYLGSGYKYYDL
jgi:uncharacterized membrane protein YGL010W